MKDVPLFIRVANGAEDLSGVARSLVTSKDGGTAAMATSVANDPSCYQYDFALFREDFSRCLVDMIDNGTSPQVRTYLNSYLASLNENVTGDHFSSKGSTVHTVSVSDKDGPWVEGLVCYNLCLYLKAFGIQELKNCKRCHKFFVGRGTHAVYCSDTCRTGGTP